jgi:hypothetical protein
MLLPRSFLVGIVVYILRQPLNYFRLLTIWYLLAFSSNQAFPRPLTVPGIRKLRKRIGNLERLFPDATLALKFKVYSQGVLHVLHKYMLEKDILQ